MNKKLISHIERNERCITLFENNPDKCSRSTALNEVINEFMTLHKEASQAAATIQSIGINTASKKHDVWESVIESCVKVGKLAYIYADECKDMNVLGKIEKSTSNMRAFRSYELVLYVEWFYPFVKDNAEALAEYGVTEQMIAELKELSEKAEELEQDPRQKIIQRKDCQIKLEEVTQEMNKLLHNKIDNLMVIFPEDDPFYIAYFSARTVVKPQTVHKEDEDSGE